MPVALTVVAVLILVTEGISHNLMLPAALGVGLVAIMWRLDEIAQLIASDSRVQSRHTRQR